MTDAAVSPSAATADVACAVAHWLARAPGDPVMAAAARGLRTDLVLIVDGKAHVLRLAEPCAVLDAPAPDAPRITIEGPGAAFARILSPVPPPGYQSYGAALRLAADLAIEADPLAGAQALAALERLFELARPASADAPGPLFERNEGAMVGRWHRLSADIDGRREQARIFALEAGEGPPLLMLHTAGADARQWRHQFEDAELQRRFRMIAFDMPYHGGSGGPGGNEAPEPYRLTEATYLAWCVAAVEQLAGGPAFVMGCSMGADMALTLLAARPDLVLGAVALEAPLKSPGRKNPLLSDARVAGARHNPSYVRALLSPTAPQVRRDEAAAIYAQARPGIYEGDLAYYSDEYDGERIAPGIAASGRPVALLTGEYDYSAPPQSTAALHAAIGSDRVMVHTLPGLGHFPMIEDPERFRPFLMAGLRWIEEGASR